MVVIEQQLLAARSALQRIPAHTFSLSRDGPPSDPGDPYDDYVIHWELRIEPRNPEACPLELWFATSPRDEHQEPSCSFGFDSWQRVANRHDLVTGEGHRFAFGVEPIWVTNEQIQNVIEVTVAGHARIHVVSVFGRVIDVSGWLHGTSVPALARRPLSIGKSYSYAAFLEA